MAETDWAASLFRGLKGAVLEETCTAGEGSERWPTWGEFASP